MQNRSRGFTLMELLTVIAILAVLIAIIIPVFSGYLEKSREAVDLANVRSAYSEVALAVSVGDTEHASKVVPLKQKEDGWQSADTINIGGITHTKGQGDTEHWKGDPVSGGECEVSFSLENGVVFNWRGGKTSFRFDLNEDMHKALLDSGVLGGWSPGTNLEIDSHCTNSSMLPKVQAQIKENSLMKEGTWAYLGSVGKAENRYLFWTSVNTDAVGAGQKIPVLIQTGDGRYYISETTTAVRTNKAGDYIAIADHIGLNNYKKYCSAEKQYKTLQDAYDAYVKLVTSGEYQQYKDTLPQ